MEFLTVNEAAKLLRISVSTLYRWSETGVVPSRKFGGHTLRFLDSDIEEFTRPKSAGIAK
jgi:excisionase family DNA binding protein